MKMMIFEKQNWLTDPQKQSGLLAPVTCFRRKFTSGAGEIKLQLSALGLYEAHLDGKQITENIFTPGWSDYNYRAEYHSYTLSVSEGEHELEVLLADGWYAGTIHGTQWGVEPRNSLLFCRMTLPQGEVITADTKWLCSSNGPLLYSDIYMGESCDFTANWQDWHPAGVKNLDLKIEPFDGVPVRRTREIFPLQIKDGIVDFGENITGRERITFSAPAGTVITIRHAEVLDEEGKLYTKNLRSAKSTNTIVASGKRETYEPTFTFHGFRYIEVEGVSDFEVTAQVIHSDMPLHLEFDSSDELLNKLVANIRRGGLGNALDVPTDCPQRDERVGWLGDAQVFVKAALYLSDCTRFFRRWLKDVRLAQNEQGYFTIVAPQVARFRTPNAAGWADAGVICPWELYRFSGEKYFLEENYDAVKKFILIRWQDFQRGNVPNADFGDWLNSNEDTSKGLLGAAFLAYSSGLALKMAQILEKQEDIPLFEEIHAAEKAHFNTRFSDTLTTQTGMALALDFELLPEEKRAEAAKNLNDHVLLKRNTHLSTGFLGTPHLLHALSANGYTDTAWALLEQKTYPSWLFSVLNGATTVWEHWNSWTPENGFQNPEMNSFNHYAYGAVLDWIIGVAAGIAPDYNIDPHPGGTLSFMEVQYRGVFLRWEKEDGKIRYTVKVPDGISAKFRGKVLSGAKVYHFTEEMK